MWERQRLCFIYNYTEPTHAHASWSGQSLTVSYLRGKSIADRVDVVARCRRAHKAVAVAGEAMAVGGQTIGRAAVRTG